MKKLNVTLTCMAVYNSSIEVLLTRRNAYGI